MRRDDRGSVIPLLAGFVLVVVGLVAVVTDVTAAYLRREALDAVADAAALAATESLAAQTVYADGLDDLAPLDPAAARAAVAAALAEDGAARRFPGLQWSVAVDGRTVVVRVVAPLTVPFHLGDTGRAVPVSGSAAAVAALDDG